MSGAMDEPMSVFPPITPFSFTSGPGNALRKAKAVQNCSACRRRKTKCDRLWPCTPCKDRGEANLCEQYVKEPNDKPTGYTHVLDTSILANRVAQLESVLSRLLTRVDTPEAYQDLLHEFKDPLPAFKPNDELPIRDRKPGIGEDVKPKHRRRDSGSTSVSHSMTANNDSQLDMAPPTTTPSAVMNATFRSNQLENIRTPGLTFNQPTSVPMNLDYLAGDSASSSNWLGGFQRGGTSTPAFMSYSDDRNQPYEPASKAPSAHEHDAALALEGMALGREIQGVSNTAPVSRDEQNEPTPGSPLTFSSFIHHKRSSKPSGDVKAFPAVQQLPSIIFGKYIITHFLENVDFRWRCLHRPSFERQFEALSERLRNKATEFYRDELATLALYATCLAVGIHFLDEEGYRDLNLNEEQAEDLAATCWQVSYQALEASDWMQIHDIRSCQTIIIAGIYLSSARRANQHWTLLGSVTKIAMALGLASVPDEAKIISGEIKRLPQRWRSTIDREVGRRVWYCLLELDQLFAIEYGFLYLISPEIHQTTEPANINDADIKDDVPVRSLPRDTYTDMSYFLQRLKLFYPFQSVVQKARKEGRMRYSFVIEANNELQQNIANMPAFYKQSESLDNIADAGQLYKIKRESVALSEGADLRLMRLHRYYFSEACHNSRYLLSKQTCLNCARSILQIKSPRGNNVHYWGHTYCMFAATMVMIIYLSYALPQELEETKAQAESGINHLRSLSLKRRTDLGESADVLQSLMNVQLERRGEQSQPEHKRNFSEMEGDAWDGWLPPDLLALARGNPGFVDNVMHEPVGSTPQDTTLLFESILDDLHFNQNNYIVM